uniref:Uncharacterized protein n=1 Tax=Arundo donax TaxID=35708 RepID=A0A0A9C871_ARUDO
MLLMAGGMIPVILF